MMSIKVRSNNWNQFLMLGLGSEPSFATMFAFLVKLTIILVLSVNQYIYSLYKTQDIK